MNIVCFFEEFYTYKDTTEMRKYMSANNSVQKSPNNITQLHIRKKKKSPINIGMVILAIILIYIVFSVVKYIRSDKIMIYEVAAGQLVSDNTFTGIAIYDETVKYSEYSGYINYFISDKQRAGVNTIICTIDETGEVYSKLSDIVTENSLDSNTLTAIRKDLTDYTASMDNLSFYQSYNLLGDISSVITEYNSNYMLDSLNDYMLAENSFLRIIKPEASTMISFTTDSLLNMTADRIGSANFNKENYSTTNHKNRSLIGSGDVLYREINSEVWNIVFELTENQLVQYADVSSVKIDFLSNNITTTADFEIIHNADGSYGMITLDKYLVNFMDSRFIDFEISENTVGGLKIPVSAVCEKEFYTIPVEYGRTVVIDEVERTGFYMLTYNNAGEQMTTFVETTYYSDENGYYYVNKSNFNIGDCIVYMPEEGEIITESSINISSKNNIYVVGTVASLKGVYCVNKGYCQFRKIIITDKNDEYYIIEKGTKYGLSIYDHIILNAQLVSENDIVY